VKKQEESVLLYQFSDEAALAIQEVLRKLRISASVLEPGAWHQRIGFLFALKGFKPGTSEEEAFDFPYEAAVFHNIKGKRLDQVLQALKDAGIAHIKFKAVTTPFNLHWTLARLCRTMHKEHAYMMERDKNSE